MKQCAIVKNGQDIVKVSNLKRKYNKIQNNPQMEIIEECDLEDLETKYNYYKNVYKKETKEFDNGDIVLYYYKCKDKNLIRVSVKKETSDELIPITKKEYDRIINKTNNI